MRLVAPLVVDYSASRRLVVDYFASAARPGPWHVARLVTRLVAPLVVDYSASCRLVVDYFASVACPGASARRAARHADHRAGSSSTTPPRAGSSLTTLPRAGS
jgi:hypothetical protein